MLSDLGQDAKALAGGQSLIPLMKLRFSNPAHLVDLNFISGTSYITESPAGLRIGAMTRHAEIEHSPVAAKIPIIHDCAAGIADVQIRNRGTIGGSLAEADPSGDWATVLMTMSTEIHCVGPNGERSVVMRNFIEDAYTTALGPDELIKEIVVKPPPRNSGGAYIAFKRSAPVYPTASAAVQLTMEDDTCKEIAIALGCVGLIAIKATEAESALRGEPVITGNVSRAMEAAASAADPQPDMRGSAEYKRALVGALVKRALEIAVRRARGEQVEVSHIYS